MPIRPEPRRYFCPSCGWEKTVQPKSDALMPGDLYSACPKCGKPVGSTRAGLLASTAAQMKELLRK